jgi:sarcosine oxidase subunit beta
MTTFDVIVIGSGVTGGSTAYHLARQGRSVLVIERSSPASEPTASWASAGGVRRQGRHAAEALLAIESIDRWPSLEAELEADMGYHGGGNLYVGEGDEQDALVAAFVKRQQANGFTDVRLLDRKEALEVVPGLADTVTSASFSPKDGQANPPLTTRAFAKAAQRHGATYWNDTITESLIVEGGKVVGVKTSKGDVFAEAVVLAAGVWSDVIAQTAGIELPIKTRAPQILITSPGPLGALKPVIGTAGRKLSLKQLPTGEFMLGGGWPGIPTSDRLSYTMLDESESGSMAAGSGILPAVGEQQVIRKWCGLEAQSFDAIPFIGPWPDLAGLTVAVGFSGHGFAISPAVGRCIADQLAGKPVPELADLDPTRIAGFDPVAVEQFMNDDAIPVLAVG